jgi:hypothetical protein
MAPEFNSYRPPYRFGLIFFFVASLTALMSLALSIDGLGPLDDHQFIRTIFQGRRFHAYILPDVGRFIPLTAQEYVLAARLFFASPELFHIMAGIKIFFCGALLLHCLMLTKAGNWTVLVLWSATVFAIGFANAGFRLQVGEINALLLLLCFVWTAIINNTGDASPIKGRIAAIAGLMAIGVTFFYKEVSFVLATTFGVAELFRHYRQKLPHFPKRILAVILLGVAYVIAYLSWRGAHKAASYASYHATPLVDLIYLFASNDPFIFFVVIPVTLIRFIRILRNPDSQTFYDSLMAGASAYALAYIVLRIYNTYYLLPAYGFAACGLAGILALQKGTLKKTVVLLSTALITLNNLPIAVADMYSLKSIANNHWKFVHSISDWIFAHPLPDAAPRNLVLTGVSPGTDVEVIHSLQTYLESLGLPASSFKIRLPLSSNNKIISDSYGMENSLPYQAKEGDLLIFNPYQSVFSAPPLLTPGYREVYRSDSDWDFQRWSGWEWIKICVVDEYDCISANATNRRYTGYAAMLVARSKSLPDKEAAPLAAPSFRIGPLLLPARMQAGSALTREVLVMNDGAETWPATGKVEGKNLVNLSYVWLDKAGKVILEGNRFSFLENMEPEDMARISIIIKAPAVPGEYKLVITPVQEGVRWFYQDSKSVTAKEIVVSDPNESLFANY